MHNGQSNAHSIQCIAFTTKGRYVTRIARKVTLTEKQFDALNQIIMSCTHRLGHIEHVKIILFSSALKQDKDIADELGIAFRTVRK